MNQYEDQKRRNQNQEIEHGLGIGGGRGRPKGSRNGYISPGAAYMKDYEIIGQRADPNRPIPMNRSSMLNNYPQQSRPQPVPRNPSPRLRNNQKAAVKAVTSMTANPAKTVEFGRNMLEQVLGAGMEKAGRLADAAQKSLEGNPMPWLNEMYVEPATSAARAIGNAVGNAQNAQNAPAKADEIRDRAGQMIKTEEPPKSFWDNLADWGNQAAKDIGDFATRAIDTGKAAYNTAAGWVNDRANEVGSWMGTAYKDVSDWVGARGRDLFGYDVDQSPSGIKEGHQMNGTHVNGVIDNVGQWIGDTAQNVGRTVGGAFDQAGRALFGYDQNQSPSATKEGHQMNGEHVNGFFDNAGRWIGDTAQNVGQAVAGAYNDASRWAGEQARNIGNAATNAWNGVTGAVDQAGRALFGYDQNQSPSATKEGHQMNGEHVNGFFDNAGNWINTAAQNVGNAVTGAYNDATKWVGDTAGNVGQWIGDRVDQAGRALFGYDETPHGNPENRAARLAGQTNHVNGVFENAANGLDRWWNGDQVIRGDANRVTSIEGNPGMRDRLEDAREVVEQAVVQGADWAKQQIYDPVANTFVSIGDFLMGAIGRPAAKAAAAGQEAATNAIAEGQNKVNELGQNIADEVNNRVIQPVQRGLRDAQAEYNFNRMYGDARSSNMLNGGVSDNVVQGINRMAANIEITENQRDNLMDAANYAMARGVPFEQINDWYALVEKGQMSPQLFASRVTGLADMSTDVIRDMQRRYGYIK